MNALAHALERTVVIAADRATVFRFFTDSERFAAWWGDGSRIDPRPGGEVHIRYPNGATAGGQVLEIEAPVRVVFTFGYPEPDKPIPIGGSTVTVTLHEHPRGTRLELRHELPSASARDAHVPGWRYQLARFAQVAAMHPAAQLEDRVDWFFAVWDERDAEARARTLAAIAVTDFAFHDAHACTHGLDDLVAHIGAAQMHMPGVSLVRAGPVRQCQGSALADWRAMTDGRALAEGTNVFELAPDGRLARAVGFGRG